MATERERRPIPAALQEFFVCGVCGIPSEYMQDPVLLPCLHSICVQCLKTRVELSLRRDAVDCPSCTRQACIPPGGLEAFPADGFSRVAKKTLTDPDFTHLPGGPNPRCGIHPKEVLAHHCQRCRVAVCKKCVASYHGDHEGAEIETLQTVAKRMDQELTSSLASALGSKLTEVTTTIDTLKRNREGMQADVDQVAQQVEERAQQLIQEVSKQKRENLDKLDQFKQQQDEPFQQALEKLEKLRSTLLDYKQYADILHNRGKDLDKTSHVPGLQELVQKQTNTPQPGAPIWHRLVRLECPAEKVDLSEAFGKIATCTSLFAGLQYRETVPVKCDLSQSLRHISLFGSQQVVHSYFGENRDKVCIHDTDGSVRKCLPVPKLVEGAGSAVVDPVGGSLVVADWGKSKVNAHRDGALHWIKLSRTYDVIKHARTKLECSPAGYINVNSKGQVLVLTKCQSNKHPHKLAVYDRDAHTELQAVQLKPGVLRGPRSAVSTASGVFAVVDGDRSRVVWLDHKGVVLRQYGDEKPPEEKLSAPHHIVQHSEGGLLISDTANHRVLLLSREGVFLQCFLSRELQGIEHPTTMHLDEQAGLLAVTCDGTSTVMVFEFKPQPLR